MTKSYNINQAENPLVIIKECLKHATAVQRDQLNCKESSLREPTSKTTEEILKMVSDRERGFYSFSIREGYYMGEQPKTDICLSVQPKETYDIEYFLWIEIPLKKAHQLVKKYNLELLY